MQGLYRVLKFREIEVSGEIKEGIQEEVKMKLGCEENLVGQVQKRMRGRKLFQIKGKLFVYAFCGRREGEESKKVTGCQSVECKGKYGVK